MLPESLAGIALAVGLALVPAGVRLRTGRSLVRAIDDPAIGERLLGVQRVNSFALAVAIALLIFLSPRWWIFPLMFVAYVGAAFPLRRALYEETWSFPRYMSFIGRLLLGTVGIWIALACAPLIVSAAGRLDWLAAIALGAVLLLWNVRSGEVLRSLMRARPLADPELRARFEALARSCAIPTPRFEQVDMRGGVLANAVALASLRGSAIVFTDTLLARLEPDEASAICAHELAHLEHFTPRRLRHLALVVSGLVVLGVSLPVLARGAGVPALVMWSGWLGALLAALIWIARDRQKNETKSDTRAVALIGDPEALVRALTKGYAISRMPRRLHPDFEKHATHPSLARRIRDIRRAGGIEPAALPEEARLAAPDASTTITFEKDRLIWREGDASLHSLGYSHLSELRVDARRNGAATLVAVERNGRRWEMPLLDIDVARAQAVLDVVDGQLSDAAARRPSNWSRTARALAMVAAIFAIPLAAFSSLLVSILALIRPVPAMLAAAGAAALTAAALAARDDIADTVPARMAIAIITTAIGVMLGISAIGVRRHENARQQHHEVGWFPAVIGVLAALSVALVALEATSAVRLHVSTRSAHSAAVLPLACVGALLFWRPRGWRIASLLGAALGLAVIAIGSVAFLDAFGRDPLLVQAPPLGVRVVNSAPIAEVRLDFPVSELRLSPSGRYVAIARAGEYDEGGSAGAFLLGVPAGPLVEVPANDLVFVDDEQVLVLERRAGGALIRKLRASSPTEPLWEQRVTGIVAPHLTVDPPAGRWRAFGFDVERRLVRVDGTLGSDGDFVRRVVAGNRTGALLAMASSDDTTIAVESRYGPSPIQSIGLWSLAGSVPSIDVDSRIWLAASSVEREIGRSVLEVRCADERRGAPRVICVTFEATRSRVVIVDPVTRRVSGIGVMTGRFFGGAHVSDGWLPGWHDGHSAAVNVETGELVRIARDEDAVVTDLTGTAHVLGAILQDSEGSRIRIYAGR
jgi:heat shock protein HtpX